MSKLATRSPVERVFNFTVNYLPGKGPPLNKKKNESLKKTGEEYIGCNACATLVILA
jgi:hypothetical protein